MGFIEVLQPSYVKDFACIGSECKLDCCDYLWRITIDKDTYKRYRSVKEPEYLVQKLEDHIMRNPNGTSVRDYGLIQQKVVKEAKITLKATKTINVVKEGEVVGSINMPQIGQDKTICPLRGADGLCDIHRELGEEALSQTCQIYPRAYTSVEGQYIQAMNTGCEAVTSLLYDIKSPMAIDTAIVSEGKIPRNIGNFRVKKGHHLDLYTYYPKILRKCIEILQNQKYSLDDRMVLLGGFLLTLDDVVMKPDRQAKALHELLEVFDEHMYIYDPLLQLKGKRYDLPIQMVLKLRAQIFSSLRMSKEKESIEHYIRTIQNCIDEKTMKLDMEETKRKVEHREKLFADTDFLENFMVNYLMTSVFPLKVENSMIQKPSQKYWELAGVYCYYKVMLMGSLDKLSGMNKQTLFYVTSLCGRTLMQKQNMVYDYIVENQITQLPMMAMMIKSC